MKIKFVSLFLILISFTATAQIAPYKYFVRFTDKNDSPYSIQNPSEYLSQRAIDRRVNQGIAIDESDLPVNPAYLQGVVQAGATLLNPSKWLNGVSIFTFSTAVVDAINELPYVAGVTKSGSTSYAPVHYGRPYYGYYGSVYGNVYDPGYYQTTTSYFIECNAYRLSDEKLVYSSQTKSVDPSSLDKFAYDFSKAIVNDLAKRGVFGGE
jgi:hypothetical protein